MAGAVVVDELVKVYGDQRAVDGVTLEVHPCEVFALLGPNGAGKSTTIEILEGHRSRTSGGVSVLGLDPGSAGRELRDRIGIVLQETGVEPELTVREVLAVYRRPYRRRRDIDETIELVGLGEKADARVRTLSGGQQRRLDLALGLIGQPELLFLDEPTTGFDPSARRGAWELIDRMRAGGTTVVLTTHYMDEARHLADRLAVIARGRIVAEGTPDTIGRHAERSVISFGLHGGVDAADLPDLTSPPVVTGRRVQVVTDRPTEVLHRLTSWSLDRSTELAGLTVERPTLEDVYLELTDDH